MRFVKSLSVVGLVAALLAPVAASARGWDDDDGPRGYPYGYDRHHGHDGDRGRDWDRGGYRYGPPPRYVYVPPPPPRPDPRAYSRGFEDGVRFADRDRDYVRGWYRRYPGYYRPVPPAYYVRPVRGAYIVPGYYEPLPPPVVAGWRPLPPGYGYYSVGADVVIAAVATGLILDVILDGR
ncbi:hypothetical protein [Zavarzinia sp.]|uniref:hypothetical protein n=1 Tax=Zavarzinia sp. TaxID=2027920 RepID=UPI0035653B00